MLGLRSELVLVLVLMLELGKCLYEGLSRSICIRVTVRVMVRSRVITLV